MVASTLAEHVKLGMKTDSPSPPFCPLPDQIQDQVLEDSLVGHHLEGWGRGPSHIQHFMLEVTWFLMIKYRHVKIPNLFFWCQVDICFLLFINIYC